MASAPHSVSDSQSNALGAEPIESRSTAESRTTAESRSTADPRTDAPVIDPTPSTGGHRSSRLAAQIEPFDSFWEGPADIEKGYGKFLAFYRDNYLAHMPKDKSANILIISCGPGYFVNLLAKEGYQNILGIDSIAAKIDHAKRHGLHCEQHRAFEYLADVASQDPESYDAIFCEQEINHLTKEEIPEFLDLARGALKPGGTLVMHALNGANPITGAEALAQNYDHYNTFTEYTMRQVLEHYGYEDVRVFGLNLYVFWKNPANYILIAAAGLLTLLFRASFILYGKSNKIFTKKIGGACRKPQSK